MNDIKLPVEAVEFWRERVFRTIATGGMLHQIILDDNYDLWCKIQSDTGGVLLKIYQPGMRVLDAGCGYGAMISCFQEAATFLKQEVMDYLPPSNYLGVDISPDLIELARYRYSAYGFIVADLRNLEARQFNLAITRAVAGMIETNRGRKCWEEMRVSIAKVADRLLVIDYPDLPSWEITWHVEDLR